jgi:hypothetical protein
MKCGTTVDITLTNSVLGELMDPDSIDVRVRDPKNQETIYPYPGDAITRMSVGTFRLRFLIPDGLPGTWVARAVMTTGDVEGTQSLRWTVQDSWT